MIELDFLKDRRPVMLYKWGGDIPFDVVFEIYNNLKKAYPDIIALPKEISIEWWTKEQLEEIRRILDEQD